MKKPNTRLLSLTLLSIALSAFSGCYTYHSRYAHAVEGVKSASDFSKQLQTKNKYHITDVFCGEHKLKSNAEEYISNRIKGVKPWNDIFEPKNHWLSLAKQKGVPIKVEVIGPYCSDLSWLGSGSSVDVVVTVFGERFGDDPSKIITEYVFCKCGETEYRPGQPNCKFTQLNKDLYWFEYSHYNTWWGWHGGDSVYAVYNAQIDVILTAVAKALKELEDDGVIPIQ